jgi:hypothetical protein
MAPVSIEMADAQRFQQWLLERQHPTDCSMTVGARARQDYFYALGLGAQMVSLKFNFVRALMQRQVYHFPTSHYVNPLRCASRSFECYFERPTNCTMAANPSRTSRRAHRRVESVKIEWCFDLPRKRLSRIAGLQGVHSKAWYHAQLAAYLFRPNREMRALGRELLGNMEGTVQPPAGGGGGGLALGRDGAGAGIVTVGRVQGAAGGANSSSCVAMHIRRTDKHTEDHRTAQRSFADFAQSFKAWGYWAYPGVQQGLRAFLGSEDKATFDAMPPLLRPFGAYWIPSSYFVMDMSAKNKFVNIRQGNERLGQLYGSLEDAAKGKVAAGRALHKDEGMVLIAQMLLMSGCEALIASFSSNVAVLVHDLMYARKVSRGEMTHAVDVNGRVYCGCGASFCMTLERKTVREAGRSIKHVIDGFKY